ncbi:Stomatin-like protein 2 [Hordeum vulgare]|nr:Stomatin-like protein 2 [Hordeum vulgare]
MLARSTVPGHLLRFAAATANPAVATMALLQRRWYRGGADPASSFYDPPPTPANLGLSIVPEKKAFVVERFGKSSCPASAASPTSSTRSRRRPSQSQTTRESQRTTSEDYGGGRFEV